MVISFCLIAGLAYPAASAGASGSSDTGFQIYYSTTYSGMIQCAGGRNQLNISAGTYTATGTSIAKKDYYCLNPFNLPAGWIQISPVVQVLAGGVWQTVNEGTTTNPSTSWYSQLIYFGSTVQGYQYRLVTGHNVLLGTGFQQGLLYSSSVWG